MDITNYTRNSLNKEESSLQIRKVKSMRDIFLSDDIEDAEIYFPSKMNDINETLPQSSTIEEKHTNRLLSVEAKTLSNRDNDSKESPFIIANTEDVSLQHLKHDCIIPVFSKDNEKTIAHQEYIEIVLSSIQRVFPHHTISTPEIRVSHQIKGRIPEAIHKSAKDLLDHEKTIYYERMAFIVKIPSISNIITGNELSLCIGGVRAYNQENLYSKKTMEKFKFFIGFQNQVCMNLCVSSDGFVEDLRVSNILELQSKIEEVMQNYNAKIHLTELQNFTQYYLSENQFAQLIGKARLYQHLPKVEKKNIPPLTFNDSQINSIAKDYYEDNHFCRQDDGRINLWDVFNLFTQADKSSYIDTFLDRNLNAFDFTKGIQKALNGNSNYHWFLS